MGKWVVKSVVILNNDIPLGGHNSSDYARYFQAAPGQVYRVLAYQHAYEPYVVFKREGPPWCDERFIGYGGNKASCLYEMYLSGIAFFVLSDDFLIHQSHTYAEDARKAEVRFGI
jgi:Glycosyl-transferase for dystroglycan